MHYGELPEYNLFNQFTDVNFLSQYVQDSTRKNNILDLFLTDNPDFVKLIKCSELYISDHLLVHIFTDNFNISSTDFIERKNGCKD